MHPNPNDTPLCRPCRFLLHTSTVKRPHNSLHLQQRQRAIFGNTVEMTLPRFHVHQICG